MLNIQKKIYSSNQNLFVTKTVLPIFILPLFSKHSYMQVSEKSENHFCLNGLEFATTNNKISFNSRFIFSSRTFKGFSFMQSFYKKKLGNNSLFKNKFFFLVQLLKYKRSYSSLFLKIMRNGFVSSIFGFTAFLPKTSTGLKTTFAKKQALFNITLTKKRKNFSRKMFVKFNFVSLLKKKKNS
jgi:hypothetical protein